MVARWLQALVAISALVAILWWAAVQPVVRTISDGPGSPLPRRTCARGCATRQWQLGRHAGTPSPQQSYRSRWVATSWNEVPGWQDDQLQDAWNAWLQNCVRPGPLFALCAKTCANSCWVATMTAACG